MGLSYKAKRRWSLVVLLVFMPLYVVVCVTVLNAIGPMHPAVQLIVYIVLGVIWIFPFKRVFLGIGQVDPDAEKPDEPKE